GGYLPTEEEIKKIRIDTKPILDSWLYPASVLDFSWRAINQNKQNVVAFNISPEEEKRIYEKHPRVLDILFHLKVKQNSPLFSQNKAKEGWINFLKLAILNFKYEQRHRRKEKWYIEHVKELM